jgi:hypothetical protein
VLLRERTRQRQLQRRPGYMKIRLRSSDRYDHRLRDRNHG